MLVEMACIETVKGNLRCIERRKEEMEQKGEGGVRERKERKREVRERRKREREKRREGDNKKKGG